MSTGLRVPLHQMEAAAESLVRRLGVGSLVVVGSIRRRRPLVGDIELVARLPKGAAEAIDVWDDPLFRTVNGLISNPMPAAEETLFAPPPPALCGKSIGSAISGLKPGFRALSLQLTPPEGPPIPCQIYRSTPRNHGWVMVQRTGPREFGIAFLGHWKRAQGIPLGSESHRACIDGHLVNDAGQVISVETEEQAFELARIKFIPPELRDIKLNDHYVHSEQEILR